MTEQLITPARLRLAVRTLGAKLFTGAQSGNAVFGRVRDNVDQEATLPYLWEQKGDRYACANAISGLLREHAIEGLGPAAVFKEIPSKIRGRLPRVRLLNGVRQVLATAATYFNTTPGTHEELMESYSHLSQGIPASQSAIRLGQGILGGGDYPHSICEYSFVASDLMSQSPDFADADPGQRRDAAHGMLIRAIGREASMYAVDLIASPTVAELHSQGEVSLRAGREFTLDLGHHRSAAHLRQGASHPTPVIGCPAHLIRPGEAESDLQTFIHAGVNFAYDLGMFD